MRLCEANCARCDEFPCDTLLTADAPVRRRGAVVKPDKRKMLEAQVMRAAQQGVSAYEAGATLSFIEENDLGEPSSPQTCGGYFDEEFGYGWRE